MKATTGAEGQPHDLTEIKGQQPVTSVSSRRGRGRREERGGEGPSGGKGGLSETALRRAQIHRRKRGFGLIQRFTQRRGRAQAGRVT